MNKDFGTAHETYNTAIKRNPSIRLQYVKDYLDKLESVQVNFKCNNYNTCVSSGANSEFEVDIVDVLARYGGDGIIHGLCAIDNFTQIMVSVITINNRTPPEIIRGLKLIFEQLGKPNQLYSDEESSLRSKEFFRFVNKTNIKTIQT